MCPRLRAEHPSYFGRIDLYIEVQRLFASLRFRVAARRFIHEIFDVNFETGMARIDELGGLNFQTKAEHFSRIKQNQDADELAQMMIESAISANVRRGRSSGAGSAVKKDEVVAKPVTSVMKPAKTLRGFEKDT